MKNIEKLDRETNRDYAYRVIRNNLVNLELKPGTMISEQDLADELKLSRTPVHEALQEIARTKIIEVFPQRGSLVSKIDMKYVDEAVFVRATLESAITEEACRLATAEDLKILEENVSLQEFYQEKNAFDKLMELDNAFHEQMYRITNKMQCYYMVRLMNLHYDRFRELRLHASDNRPVISEHKQILEAFQARDSQKAKELILQHLGRMHTDEKDVRKKYPEYFA